MQLVDFLKLVLPQEGKKCFITISTGEKSYTRQGFVDTFEELAEALLQIDRQGKNAFFACATYKTAESRRAINALACKSFWLDIDRKSVV